MLTLDNRPLNVSNGTLFVALSNGRIQVWSHHHKAEGFITDFNAIHIAGDVSKWLIDVFLKFQGMKNIQFDLKFYQKYFHQFSQIFLLKNFIIFHPFSFTF
jgi:hypothetical protein